MNDRNWREKEKSMVHKTKYQEEKVWLEAGAWTSLGFSAYLFSLVLSVSFCQLKKDTAWEFRVKFYLGQNEDYSLGDSILDSSEKLFQRGRGEKVSIYVVLVKGEYIQSSTYFLLKTSSSFIKIVASHQEQTTPWRILVLFWIWGYENWTHKISSWKYLTVWKPILPVFPRVLGASCLLSTLNSFQGGVEGQHLQQHLI